MEEYGEPPGRPKDTSDPARMARYDAALADFKRARAAAVEKAKEKRRGEIADVRAQMGEPLAAYKGAQKAARRAHAAMRRADADLVALVRTLHADPGDAT